MAQLLVRTVSDTNAKRYLAGDIIVVAPDGALWGRMESLKVWKAEGKDPALWTGGYVIIDLPDLSLITAKSYLAEGLVRRLWTVAYPTMERRAKGSGRDTLNVDGYIKRRFADVLLSFKLK